jgi:hypothetical protein
VPQPFSAIDAPADGVIHNAYQLSHFLSCGLSPEEYYAKYL